MENFVLYNEIGKVNEQTIYKARRKGTIKYLAISCADRNRRSLISNHVRFVYILKSANVVKFQEWYETSNHLWLVMELCTGGSLDQVIKEDGRLPENLVRKFGSDIVRDGSGRVKFFDFSLSHLEGESLEEVLIRFSESEEIDEDIVNGELQVVSAYTSPEVLKTGEISIASDYWGFGCLLYEMFYGYPPFNGETQEEIVEKILHQHLVIPKISEYSSSLVKLLNALLVKEPSKRISTTDLLNHEFWQNRLSDLSLLYSSDAKEPQKEGNLTCMDADSSECGTTINGDLEDSLDVPARLDLSASDETGPKTSRQIRANCTSNQRVVMAQEALAVRTSLIGANIRQDGLAACTQPVSFTLHTTSPIGVSSRKQDPGQSATETTETIIAEVVLSDKKIYDQPELRRRMTYNEYMPSHDVSQTTGDIAPNNWPLLSEVDFRIGGKPASPETRATLAMVYPWGDDSSHLPQEISGMLAMWTQLEGVVGSRVTSKETGTPMTRRRRLANRIMSSVSALTTWKPKQLNDYYRWSRSTPPIKVEGLFSTPLNVEKLCSLSSEKLDVYLIEMLRLFRLQYNQLDCAAANPPRTGSKLNTTRQPSTTVSFNLLDYLIWLFATISSQSSRLAVVSCAHSVSRLAILVDLFVESGRQLKAASGAPVDCRISLCRLCCLAAHRIACCLVSQHQNATPPTSPSEAGQMQLWWKSVCLALPSCLATTVDLLREQPSRTNFRLCHYALLTIGELLLCTTCILQATFRAAATNLGSGQSNVDPSPQLYIPSNQWQTLVYYLLRCLSPSSSSGGIAAGGGIGINNRQPSRTGGSLSVGGRTAQDGVFTEAHVRLTAARAVDAFVVAILANDLHDQSSVCPTGTGDASVGSSLATASHAVSAIASSDVVIRLWSELTGNSDGPSSAPMSGTTGQSSGQLRQDLSLTCASALAGIVRINPALFTSSLLGRISSGQFASLLEPPNNNLTTLVTRLMSAAASGLLVPLSNLFHERPRQKSLPGLTRQQSHPSGGSGTPAACRRILGNQRFINAVLRYLECPHTMMRCKAYLLSAAIISNNPQEALPLAFDARLPLCLERDLRATEHVNAGQTPAMSTAVDSCTADVEASPASGNSDTKRLVYLAATTQYLVDFLVTSIVPLICNRVLDALGCSPLLGSNSTRNSRVSRAPSLGGGSESNRASLLQRSSNPSGVNMTIARAWLPTYQCISNLVVACPMMRGRVFTASLHTGQVQPQAPGGPDEEKTNQSGRQKNTEFSLLVFLGQLLNFWASADPITSAATVTSVHQSGSVENQLLFSSLVIIEEFSQQAELVEACQRDFICLVLPGLARLAVGSGARPETRAICAKIINNIAQQLRCERRSESLSDMHDPIQGSLRQPRTSSSGRPLSADADLLLEASQSQSNSLPKAQSLSDILTTESSDARSKHRSLYVPQTSSERQRMSGSATTASSSSGSGHNNLAAAFHPPSADAVAQLFEVVNQLMIPYADTLIACPEAPSAQTAFIRLLHVLLTTVPSQERSPSANNSPSITASTPVGADSNSTAVGTAARNLVAGISSHGLDVGLVRLLANQLLASGGDANSVPSTSHVASTMCLTIFCLVPQLLRWPKESRPSRMIIDLRLLELITIAVLQLGDSFETSEISESRGNNSFDLKVDGSKMTQLAKSARKSSQYTSALNSGRAGQKKSPVTARQENCQVNGIAATTKSCDPSMCAPLLAALDAMNALLNHVAHVVRIALTARSANYPESETVALAAEEILAASRPPSGLAGLLVRFIAKWQLVKCDEGSEQNMNHRLGESAIRGLTSFASLYGGEYSRTALTRPASSSLSMALLYVSAEEEKVTRTATNRTSTTMNGNSCHKPPRQPKPDEEFIIKRCRAAYRRRLRLLLRIICRLVSSDHVCRSYLLQEASMKKEKGNLYTTLELLAVKAERTADAPTLKLVREIIGIVSPPTKFTGTNRTASYKKCSKERAATAIQ